MKKPQNTKKKRKKESKETHQEPQTEVSPGPPIAHESMNVKSETASPARTREPGSWLQKNKIFFETMTAVLLSAFAAAQFWVMHKQLGVFEKHEELFKKQESVMRFQYLPRFQIVKKEEPTGHPLYPKEHNIYIYNRQKDAAASDFGLDYVEFLTGWMPAPHGKDGNLKFALKNYFPYAREPHTLAFVDPRVKGISLKDRGEAIALMQGHGNLSALKELDMEVNRKLHAASSPGMARLDVTVYLRLRYFDPFGDSHDEYYEFTRSSFGAEGIRMGPTDGQAKFSEHRRQIDEGTLLDFLDLDADKIVGMISARLETSKQNDSSKSP